MWPTSPGEQVVVVGRPPRGLEHRERLAAEVFALRRAPGRPEQRREACGHSRRDEHLPHLAAARLGREPGEPGRELAVTLPDHLRVVRGEETAEVAVHAFGPPEIAVKRYGERRLPVAHPVGLQLDERRAQPVRLRRRRRIHHRGGRALGLLHVRHHRVALGEVVPLRPPDPAPGRLHRPGPPLERHGHHRVQAVELPEQVRVGLAGRGQERVEDHRLAVEPQVTALRLELREGEPPVHPAPVAPSHTVPGRLISSERSREASAAGRMSIGVCSDTSARPASTRARKRAAAASISATEVGRRARAPALPPLRKAGRSSRRGPVGHRPQAGIERPDEVGLELLHAAREKRAALPPGDRYDAGAVGVLALGRTRPAEHIEVEARVGVESREQPLPAAEHPVDLFGRTPVDHRGLKSARP